MYIKSQFEYKWEMKNYITMHDIANRLKLSRSAVSFALNDKYEGVWISNKIREKIKDTAKEMGYCRNAVVQSLVTGRTKVIAYISWPDEWHEYVSRTINGLISGLSLKNYSVRFFQMNQDTSLKDLCREIMEQRIEGIVVRNNDQKVLSYLLQTGKEKGIPILVFGHTPNLNSGIYIKSDDFLGVNEGMKFLYKQGHRHIGFFSTNNHPQDERLLAFTEMVKQLKLVNRPEDNVFPSTHLEQRELASKIVTKRPDKRPSAYFCSSDYIATILTQEAYKHGLSIPKEISIMGFGNLHDIALINPELTTISQPFEEEGQCAADLLINEIERKDRISFRQPILKRIKTKLIVRNSTVTI